MRAAVMAEDICARNIQCGEKLGHILSHIALGIGGVVCIIRRRVAFAIAAQIGNNHIMVLRQCTCLLDNLKKMKVRLPFRERPLKR